MPQKKKKRKNVHYKRKEKPRRKVENKCKTNLRHLQNENICIASCMMNKKSYVFIQLNKNGILSVFNNKSSSRKQILIIKLYDCEIVVINNQNKSTTFRYGIELILKNEKKVSFSFKKNNCRHEWFTHIDFLIHNPDFAHDNEKHESKTENEMKKNKCNENYDTSIKSIQCVLDRYNKWQNELNFAAKMNTELNMNYDSLESLLRNELNMDHVDILNYFHCITVAEERQNEIQNYTPCVCNLDGVNCNYVRRHKERGKRVQRGIVEVNVDGKQNESSSIIAQGVDFFQSIWTRFVASDDNEVLNNDVNNMDDEKENQDNNITHHDELLCELLDKIHCYLYHSRNQNIDNQSGYGLKRDDISDKFLINVETEDEKQNNNNVFQNEDEKGHNNNNFAFGCSFQFYENRFGNYIQPKYSTLKQELLCNPYYTFTVKQYYNFYLKAIQLRKSKHVLNIKAQDSGIHNEECGIHINDPITINHLISLLIYCNETEAQKIFKTHTRKKNTNDSYQSVFKRQTFIANWTRYLTESVIFYGTPLKENEYVYCGINSKLIFKSFHFHNYCPLSTSSEINVANNFATIAGIIMKLQSNDPGSLNCAYFDMMCLSDYPAEKEKLFCGIAELKCVDIIINGNSNKNTVLALQLLELVLTGSLFYYKWNKEIYDDHVQIILAQLLKNYINYNDSNYFSKSTSSLIDSFIWRHEYNDSFGDKLLLLNYHQISQLTNEELNDILNIENLKSSLFSSQRFKKTQREFECFIKEMAQNRKYLQLQKDFRIYVIKEIQQIKLKNKQLIKIKRINTKHKGIEIGNFNVNDFKFKFVLAKKLQNDQCYFLMILILNPVYDGTLIPYGLKISWDIVCKETQYQRNQIYSKLAMSTNFSHATSIFSCSRIAKLKSLSFDLCIRVVGITFQ
eukprot:35559_1